MKVLISGICGHMGKELEALFFAPGATDTLACGVDYRNDGSARVPVFDSFESAPADVDCVIDFSHHSLTSPLLSYAVKNRIPLVLATTGQTEEEKESILAASRSIPLFFAANYSLGAAVLCELAKETASFFPEAEIEIVEVHHDRKLDSPSGTALAIANAICEERPDAFPHSGRTGIGKRDPNEIGIHSLRMGNVVGIHEVHIATKTQTITLKHEAFSRALFAEGALRAASFVVSQKPGLYNMKSLISHS